jgi:hypothetical protein
MSTVLILLTASVLVGFILGFYFSWRAILISGLILAIMSAVQNADFRPFAGVLQPLSPASLPIKLPI